MHTILDIHVCIAKFKIQIEKTHCLKNKTCFFKEKLTWFELKDVVSQDLDSWQH